MAILFALFSVTKISIVFEVAERLLAALRVPVSFTAQNKYYMTYRQFIVCKCTHDTGRNSKCGATYIFKTYVYPSGIKGRYI